MFSESSHERLSVLTFDLNFGCKPGPSYIPGSV